MKFFSRLSRQRLILYIIVLRVGSGVAVYSIDGVVRVSIDPPTHITF
jgi:hypothetical protein